MAPTTNPAIRAVHAIYRSQRGAAFCMAMVGMIDAAKTTTIRILSVIIFGSRMGFMSKVKTRRLRAILSSRL
jgi:hypothetical protein